MSGARLGPFVKWIGGKTHMLPALLAAVPEHFGRYIEPMAGGAALFWALAASGRLQGRPAILCDTNEWLIRTFEMVRDAPADLLEVTAQLQAEYHKAPEAFFYQVRSEWNGGRRDSARFIFLKQTSFNGLWRLNRQGALNMPWGHYAKPSIHCPERIFACSRALQDVELRCQSYRACLDEMQRGDVVYFDPPYHGTFNGYSGLPFSGDEHARLIADCADLAARAVAVLYTHADSPDVRQWLLRWPEATLRRVATRRSVNRNGAARGGVFDLLVRSRSTTPS